MRSLGRTVRGMIDKPYHRTPRIEQLEDRRLLSVALPGMCLADPAVDRFDGQTFYLDFDGAEHLDYNGPVTVKDIDVPAFSVPDCLTGERSAIIGRILDSLNDTFNSAGVAFTDREPVAGISFSTIFIGGDDSRFSEYGSFKGLAEQVDIGNATPDDNAFVFSDVVFRSSEDGADMADRLAHTIAHEAGHLLGYEHTDAVSTSGVLDDVAEADDTWSGARLVEDEETVANVLAEGDEDWYKIQVYGPGTLSWEVYSFSGGPILGLTAYKSGNAHSGSYQFDGPVSAGGTASVSGIGVPDGWWTFYAFVHNATGVPAGNGYYRVTADFEPIELPTLSIGDASVTEGDSGSTTLTFAVTLSKSWSEEVRVTWGTADGTATRDVDYQASSGTLVFSPGETTEYISISAFGDTDVEPDEYFVVNLITPTNATVSDSQGIGTIRNNDTANHPPTVTSLSHYPDDVYRDEGLTLIANGVSDPDPSDSVAKVEFYWDTDINGSLVLSIDEKIGEDTDGSDGWSWTDPSIDFPIGASRFFARAVDSHGLPGDAVATPLFEVNIPNRPPDIVITSPPLGGATITSTDTYTVEWSASDIEGGQLVIDLAYDFDTTPGDEISIATGLANTGSFVWSVPEELVGREVYIRGVVHDDRGVTQADYSDGPLVIALSIALRPPEPNPVCQNENLTLMADVDVPDGWVLKFFHDNNYNGQWDESDRVLEPDSDSPRDSTWTWTGLAAEFDPAVTNHFFARAQDSDGAWRGLAPVTCEVTAAPWSISGWISFCDIGGVALDGPEYEAMIPRGVTVALWANEDPSYDWPGRFLGSTYVKNTSSLQPSEFRYTIRGSDTGFHFDGLIGGETYTIGVSATGSDWKLLRVQMRKTTQDGILVQHEEHFNVRLTYEDVRNKKKYGFLKEFRRLSGEDITWQVDASFSDAEIAALRRAMDTWEATEIVSFADTPVSPGFFSDIKFSWTQIDPQGGSGLATFRDDRLLSGVCWYDIEFFKSYDSGVNGVMDFIWQVDEGLKWEDVKWWSGFRVQVLENVALHEIGHALGLRYPTDQRIPEGDFGDKMGQQWSVMDYCGAPVWLGWSDVVSLAQINDISLTYTSHCAVDLVLSDTDGNIVSKTRNEIPGATYVEGDLDGDGEIEDHIIVPEAMTGEYSILVVPELGADPNEPVTLIVEDHGRPSLLLDEVLIGNLPTDPITTFVDRTAPAVTIDTLLSRDPTPILTGTVDDPAASIGVMIGEESYEAINNGDGTWTLPDDTIYEALTDGIYDVCVAASDLTGNIGEDDTSDELTIDTTPPVPGETIVLNMGLLQRSHIDEIAIGVSECVIASLPLNAVQILRNGSDSVALADISMIYDEATDQLRLGTSGANLTDGDWELHISPEYFTDEAGNALDIDGDGSSDAGTGNFASFFFHKLTGDANGDRWVDNLDVSLVQAAYGTSEGEPGFDPNADLYLDGTIDDQDVAVVQENLGNTLDSIPARLVVEESSGTPDDQSLEFGNHWSGSVIVPIEFDIRSDGEQTLVIEQMEITGDDAGVFSFEISGESAGEPYVTLLDDESRTIRVSCQLAEPGDYAAQLIFWHNDETQTNPLALSLTAGLADPNLEQAIRDALGMPTGDLTPAVLATVDELDAEGRGIEDVRGLEYCTGLTHLDLSHNNVIDVAPLEPLMGLTTLDLGFNSISDVSALTGLVQLESVALNNNQLTDIAALAGLTNLERSFLWTNPVTDVSPLVDNLGLGTGDRIFLADLALTEDAATVQIPAICARGAEVYYQNVAFDWTGDYWYEHIEANTTTTVSRTESGDVNLTLGHLNLEGGSNTGETFSEQQEVLRTEFDDADWLAWQAGIGEYTATRKALAGVNLMHLVDREINTRDSGLGPRLGQSVLLRKAEDPSDADLVGEYTYFGHHLSTGGAVADVGTVVLRNDHTAGSSLTSSGGAVEDNADTWSVDSADSRIQFGSGGSANVGCGGLMIQLQDDDPFGVLGFSLMMKKGSNQTIANAWGQYLVQEFLTDSTAHPVTRWGTLDVAVDGTFALNLTQYDGSTTTQTGTLTVEEDGTAAFLFDASGLTYRGALSADGEQIAIARMGQDANGEVGITLAVRSIPADRPETVTLLVSSTNDEIDPYDGDITLREAILYSELGVTKGIITFAPALDGATIVLTGFELEVNGKVAIDASALSSLTIDRSGPGAIFDVLGEATLTGLTVTGANWESWDEQPAIWNRGTLMLVDCTVSGNEGGAITNDGYRGADLLTIEGCTISDNRDFGIEIYYGTTIVTNSTISFNGSAFGGGAVQNHYGTLTISDSLISGNSEEGIVSSGDFTTTLEVTDCIISGNLGSGIAHGDGSATVVNCAFLGNSDRDDGGGIRNNGGTMTVVGSSFVGNTSHFDGAGIYNDGDLSLVNCTFARNVADDNGGGIYHLFGELDVTNCTFVENSAEGRGYYSGGGGIYVFGNSSKVALDNTIVAGNEGADGPDIYRYAGTLSGSHNLIGSGTGQTALVNGSDGNQVGDAASPLDPMLGEITELGDGHWSYSLLPGSPAIDAGDNALLPVDLLDLDGDNDTDEAIPFDAAGMPRVLDGHGDGTETVDIGAFEYSSPVVVIPGDLNGDGTVGAADLDIVRGNWGQTVQTGSLPDGDPSGDGTVGASDLDIVRANWGIGIAASASATAPAIQSPASTPFVISPYGTVPREETRQSGLVDAALANWDAARIAWAEAIDALGSGRSGTRTTKRREAVDLLLAGMVE